MPPNVFYLRNWQVTFLLYTLGVFISEYTAKAFHGLRDYRVVFLINHRKYQKATFRGASGRQGHGQARTLAYRLQKHRTHSKGSVLFLIHPHTIFDYPVLIFYALLYALFLLLKITTAEATSMNAQNMIGV